MPKAKTPFLTYVWVDAHDALPPEQRGWSDYVNYLQHRIYCGNAFRYSETGEYTNLKYDYLKAVIPSDDLSQLKTWLVGTKEAPIKGNLIECDWRFWEGDDRKAGKCCGYKINDAYASRHPFRTPIRDERLSDRIKALQRKDYKSYTKTLRAILRNLKRVDIDLPVALSMLSEYEFEVEDGWNQERARESTRQLIQIISDKSEVMPKRCDYKRCHHVYTRLARGFRSLLTVDGAKMINIDIANSQPLFLYLSVVPFILSGGIGPVDFGEEFIGSFIPFDVSDDPVGPTHPLPLYYPTHESIPFICAPRPFLLSSLSADLQFPTPSLSCHSYTTPNGGEEEREGSEYAEVTNHSLVSDYMGLMLMKKFPDLDDYRREVEGGTLYQTLMKAVGWAGTKQGFKNECVFKFYYGPNNDRGSDGKAEPCLLKPVFKNRWPTVWSAIRAYKKKNGWKELAREMQRREAAVMIDAVCVRIVEELPDCVFFPIHDSIMCQRQYEERVKAIMFEEFARVGLRPTLGVTDYVNEREAK